MTEITNEKQINIAVEKLVPKLLEGCDKIFCDNGDYTVHFSFDEEWANQNVKTALFVCGGGTFYSVFEGEDCEVPEIDGGTTCYIGVVSGDIVTENVDPKKKTTRWVCVEAVPTITSIAKEPKSPPRDVYIEFMALLNKYIEQGGGCGSAGVSPTVTITEIENGYRVTIVDVNGEKTFDVTNGKDGFSPIIETENIDNGHRVTITDIEGTKSFDVLNGEKGEQGENGNDYILTDADKSEIANLAKFQYETFYNNSRINVKDNTFYYSNEPISNLDIVYPEGNFICGFQFAIASEDDVTITLPSTSKYIGDTPTFANGETWELNIRNGIVVGGVIQ